MVFQHLAANQREQVNDRTTAPLHRSSLKFLRFLQAQFQGSLAVFNCLQNPIYYLRYKVQPGLN